MTYEGKSRGSEEAKSRGGFLALDVGFLGEEEGKCRGEDPPPDDAGKAVKSFAQHAEHGTYVEREAETGFGGWTVQQRVWQLSLESESCCRHLDCLQPGMPLLSVS